MSKREPVSESVRSGSRERTIGQVIEPLGFELVALERGGGRRRPLLRLRVDRIDGVPGRSSEVDRRPPASHAQTRPLPARLTADR